MDDFNLADDLNVFLGNNLKAKLYVCTVKCREVVLQARDVTVLMFLTFCMADIWIYNNRKITFVNEKSTRCSISVSVALTL